MEVDVVARYCINCGHRKNSLSIFCNNCGFKYSQRNMKVKSELWDVFATGKRLVEKKIKTFTDFEKGPEMVMVPVGSFMMGSPEDEEYRDDWEGPQHKVSITTPFAISKFAITYDEWDFSYQLGGVTHKPYSETPKARGQLPVTRVSWEQVQKYLAWLSLKSGKKYRLPTEAEWEYAARAGSGGPFSFEMPVTADKAAYDSTRTYADSPKSRPRKKTVQVGSLPPNQFGLHEMHGNVQEWVEDVWHDDYNGAPTDGSAWVKDDLEGKRVIRGGHFSAHPGRIRSASRDKEDPEDCSQFIGFRVVRDLKEI